MFPEYPGVEEGGSAVLFVQKDAQQVTYDLLREFKVIFKGTVSMFGVGTFFSYWKKWPHKKRRSPTANQRGRRRRKTRGRTMRR